jgi:hypothetical protein
MQYVVLIYQGSTPLPGSPAWEAMSAEEQKQIYADYGKLNSQPGVTGGPPMGLPEDATTVRVQDGKPLMTDGPFVESKEALAGLFVVEARDLDQALAIGRLVPIMDGGVEVRPLLG